MSVQHAEERASRVKMPRALAGCGFQRMRKGNVLFCEARDGLKETYDFNLPGRLTYGFIASQRQHTDC